MTPLVPKVKLNDDDVGGIGVSYRFRCQRRHV
jgi:hypothetical protein